MAILKNLMLSLFLLPLIFLAGCTDADEQEDAEHIVPDTQADVVAIVNGEEITVTEVTAMQQLFAQQGQHISEQDAIEQLISQEVVIQQAEQQGFEVSAEEAEAEVEMLLAQQGISLEEYKQHLATEGLMDYDELINDVRVDLTIQNYLNSAIEDQAIQVSQEDAMLFYEMYKEQAPEEELLPFEEVEQEIIMMLQQDKQQEAVNNLVHQLRLDADIEYVE